MLEQMRRLKIPKCLKCESFCWWDGDYCCVEKMQIFSHERNKCIFDDRLIKTLKDAGHDCEDYKKSTNLFALKMHTEEYIQWKELHDLEKQLERHVRP